MIHFNEPIIDKFVKREKRFFAYMENNLAHCVNTGKMADLLIPGEKCILSKKDSGKLQYTWEAEFSEHYKTWVGTNTMNPNKLAVDLLKDLFPNKDFKREVTFTNYRADFANSDTIVEVKHVHWRIGDIAYFPDCIAERGARQVNILADLVTKYSCYLIYIIQRDDVDAFSVADFVDSKYSQATKLAKNNGVKSMAFTCKITEQGIKINKEISKII